MRAAIAPLLLVIPTGALSQTATHSSPDIVVVGHSLTDTKRALDACLARHCPPVEDIEATLAHAENQFLSGDYHGASRTVRTSVGRNHRFAQQYPVEVSDLLRADARISAHLGDNERDGFRTADTVSALKKGFTSDDSRVLAAQVELGDWFVRAGRVDEAVASYRKTARRAAAAGATVVQGAALLRIASLYSAAADKDPAMYAEPARAAVKALTDDPDPKLAVFAQAGRLLEARNAARHGDNSAVDRFIAQFGTVGGKSPILIYSPAIDLHSSGGTEQNGLFPDRDFEGQWVDVSFWVEPNGHTREVNILRQSKELAGNWPSAVLTAIRGRRYTPLPLPANDPGILRVERYTYTSHWTTNTRSRIRVRSATPNIVMLDLSADPQPAAKPG